MRRKCLKCKENDFRIREVTVYNGKLHPKSILNINGTMNITESVTTEIVDVFCRNCNEPLKFERLDCEYRAIQ